MKMCSSCKIARYCSNECQIHHRMIHKNECNNPYHHEFIDVDMDGEEVD